MKPLRLPFAIIALLLCWPASAWAGMPSIGPVLNEVPRMRLQSLSFFLAGFLLSALCVQFLWNLIRKDFTFLPRLSYGRAVGLVTLWGLVFVLVLTMISGARELMTPGAWEPSGITSRLTNREDDRSSKPADPPATPRYPSDDVTVEARREQLERLKSALWNYARTHGGQFPSTDADPAIPAERWRLPGTSGATYRYLGGTPTLFDSVPLAYEPEVHGEPRWMLFTDGTLRQVSNQQIRLALAGGKR